MAKRKDNSTPASGQTNSRNTNKFNDLKRSAYLEQLRQGVRRGKAAAAVGVDRVTVWYAMKDDPLFAAAVTQAELDACEHVEDALFLAATEDRNVTAIQVYLYNRCGDRWKDMRAVAKMDPLDAFLNALPPEQRQQAMEVLGRASRPGGGGEPAGGDRGGEKVAGK